MTNTANTLHPSWSLPIEFNDVALILTPCPGTKGVDLTTSLQQLKSDGVRVIVTALDFEELEAAGVAELPSMAEKLGLTWLHQPIEDDCAPGDDFDERWQKNKPKVQQVIDDGGNVALHCMGGSGRTGLLAAHILLDLGWPLDKIKAQVKALRPGAFSKQIQIDYIDQVAKKMLG